MAATTTTSAPAAGDAAQQCRGRGVKQGKFAYLHGFGNEFESEAEPQSLPEGQNNPQRCPRGLYAEQLSGTAFTVPRDGNQRSWLYRIRPSVHHKPQQPLGADAAPLFNADALDQVLPDQLRWSPLDASDVSSSSSAAAAGTDAAAPLDFLSGMVTMAGAGEPATKTGVAVHQYVATVSMVDKGFYNADGDMLIVPQRHALTLQTEFGWLEVAPGEICVVQRGMVFSVHVPAEAASEAARGYVCEVYNGHFKLPDLGPIGANGLANARDFQTPVAAYERRACAFRKCSKFLNRLFVAELEHSPYDVVAWHGNYAPYKYNLDRYCAINSVSYDHMDPSIFTVLTCATAEPGVAACDFVCFPPRWMVAEHTFRPPYYHRNCMSEYMGLVRGVYDAKEGGGFVPGGASLHSCMTPHGPDAATFEKATSDAAVAKAAEPVRYPGSTMAFMFESAYVFKLSAFAVGTDKRQKDYHQCWQALQDKFDAGAGAGAAKTQ